jgi:hypothetical protein
LPPSAAGAAIRLAFGEVNGATPAVLIGRRQQASYTGVWRFNAAKHPRQVGLGLKPRGRVRLAVALGKEDVDMSPPCAARHLQPMMIAVGELAAQICLVQRKEY